MAASGVRTVDQAYAAAVAQRLVGPTQALLGFQELIVERVREAGPVEALPDLERVLVAAQRLESLVASLIDGSAKPVEGDAAEAELRHDLRTPINAILGYAEMVVEEVGAELPPQVGRDLATVQSQARALLERIDLLVSQVRSDRPAFGADAADLTIAAQIARTIDTGPRKAVGKPGRILVVDDVKSNRDLLARRLRRDGHFVAKARSGEHALEVLREQEFDLLLVDVLMPGMNGIELLRQTKSDLRLHDVPVLMISGLKEEAAVIRCIAEGAEDYLPKPVDGVLLRARIEACLERRRSREREQHYLEQIQSEMDRANRLLHAILPTPIVERLNSGETMIADRFETATILFADIVDFSPMAARTPPSVLLARLGALFSRFDELAEAHGVEKIKTIGDAYMAAAGIPEPRLDHAVSAVNFARSIVAEAARAGDDPASLRLRVGIHSGPVVAGLIGRKRFVYDVWGHTVNVASRMESSGTAGRIHISSSTLDALGGMAEVEHRGEVEMKGIGSLRTYLVLP